MKIRKRLGGTSTAPTLRAGGTRQRNRPEERRAAAFRDTARGISSSNGSVPATRADGEPAHDSPSGIAWSRATNDCSPNGLRSDAAAEHDDGIAADKGSCSDPDRSEGEPAVLDQERLQHDPVADAGPVADLEQIE